MLMTLWNESDMVQLGKERAHTLPTEQTACGCEHQAAHSSPKLHPKRRKPWERES